MTSDLEPQATDATGDDAPRELAWLDHPTCEELAWLDHLRLRVASRKPGAPEQKGEPPLSLLDARLLKHR